VPTRATRLNNRRIKHPDVPWRERGAYTCVRGRHFGEKKDFLVRAYSLSQHEGPLGNSHRSASVPSPSGVSNTPWLCTTPSEVSGCSALTLMDVLLDRFHQISWHNPNLLILLKLLANQFCGHTCCRNRTSRLELPSTSEAHRSTT
jgi:hypothetical protein